MFETRDLVAVATASVDLEGESDNSEHRKAIALARERFIDAFRRKLIQERGRVSIEGLLSELSDLPPSEWAIVRRQIACTLTAYWTARTAAELPDGVAAHALQPEQRT